MQRRLLVEIAAVVALFLVALLFMWQINRPVQREHVGASSAEPKERLVSEMECIDRVSQNKNLRPEQVDIALAACR